MPAPGRYEKALLVGVPPTGRSFSVQHIHWFTLASGTIAEHRATHDDIGMMIQLGLLPAPPMSPPR
jgi:predicted ester cyclase